MPKEVFLSWPNVDIPATKNLDMSIGWEAGESAAIRIKLDDRMVSRHLRESEITKIISILTRVKGQLSGISPVDLAFKPGKMTAYLQDVVSNSKLLPITLKASRYQLGEEYNDNVGKLIYLREKIRLSGDTIEAGRSSTPEAAENFKSLLLRDLSYLNSRFDAFVEDTLIKVLFDDVRGVDGGWIDIGYAEEHRLALCGEGWNRPGTTIRAILESVDKYLAIYKTSSDLFPTHAYCDGAVVEAILRAHNASTVKHYISDAQIEEYYHTGVLKNFCGLDWDTTISVPDDCVAFVNWSDYPIGIISGPSVDFAAPKGHKGKFAKGWIEQDLGIPMILLEYNFRPVLYKPEQVLSFRAL